MKSWMTESIMENLRIWIDVEENPAFRRIYAETLCALAESRETARDA